MILSPGLDWNYTTGFPGPPACRWRILGLRFYNRMRQSVSIYLSILLILFFWSILTMQPVCPGSPPDTILTLHPPPTVTKTCHCHSVCGLSCPFCRDAFPCTPSHLHSTSPPRNSSTLTHIRPQLALCSQVSLCWAGLGTSKSWLFLKCSRHNLTPGPLHILYLLQALA